MKPLQYSTLSVCTYCGSGFILYRDQRVCRRCRNRLKIHNKGCNAMYVNSVERDSKYTIRAHDIFTYNFLNIHPILNPKKF